MSVLPTLQDATQVISSELQTLFTNKQIVLSDAANLLDTNIRNMTVASRPHFYNVLRNISEMLQEFLILNENLMLKYENNTTYTNTPIASLVTNLVNIGNSFSQIFTNTIEYKNEVDKWNSTVFVCRENISNSHVPMENKWNLFLSHFGSENFTTALTISDGGENNVVGDVLSLSTNSSTANIEAVVDSTLDGVIDLSNGISITAGGSDFAVNDVLTVSGGSGVDANISVSTIKDGYVDGVTINSRGVGFLPDDDITITTTSSGTGVDIDVDFVRGNLSSISVTNNGTDYRVNDNLTITNSNFNNVVDGTIRVDSIQNAAVDAISVTDGGSTYSLNETLEFSLDTITAVSTTINAISIDAIETSQLSITNGGSNYSLGETLTMSLGDNITNITADVASINTITYSTNEISLSGGSNYELNDTVTMSHGAITGITCQVDEIGTTITTADVSISGGSGFVNGDTLSFAYGDLSGTAEVTGISAAIADNNISLDNGGSGYSVGGSLDITYGDIGTINTTIDSINNITYSTNEISLSGGSNYELNDTVTISHGAITGITCQVDEIGTTITTADVSISGGSGFVNGDTLSFAYGDLSGTAEVTGISAAISDNNISLDNGGSGYSVGGSLILRMVILEPLTQPLTLSII